jgi:hypothetical protein
MVGTLLIAFQPQEKEMTFQLNENKNEVVHEKLGKALQITLLFIIMRDLISH